jgi:dTDP-4-amino-4,6-dideoxygalactose transaminase
MKIEFYKHNLDKEDINEVLKVFNSLFLTSGNWVSEFEKKFAEYTGNSYAIATTSCTDSLFLSLKAIGVDFGDEVITTPLSFVSTANVIEHCNAKPVFVDVESDTGNINIQNIEEKINSKTKAIIPVHLYGQMCNMSGLKSIADKHNLKIIEDAAHCIEGERDGNKPGQVGDFSCYSFYATKNITCGEGGAICSNNLNDYEWLKQARLHGLSKSAADRYTKKYEHYDLDFLGYKANMTNISAALLIHQLDKIEEYLLRKEEIAKRYDKGLFSNPGINVPKVLANSKHARYVYTILVDPDRRDFYMHKLQKSGIGVAVNFRPIHLMKYYREKYGYKRGDFPIAENIGDRTITIPLYPKLKDREVDYIIAKLNEIVSL